MGACAFRDQLAQTFGLVPKHMQSGRVTALPRCAGVAAIPTVMLSSDMRREAGRGHHLTTSPAPGSAMSCPSMTPITKAVPTGVGGARRGQVGSPPGGVF